MSRLLREDGCVTDETCEFPKTLSEAGEQWERARRAAIEVVLKDPELRLKLSRAVGSADQLVFGANHDAGWDQSLDGIQFQAGGRNYWVLQAKTRLHPHEWVRERLTIIRYKDQPRPTFENKTLLFAVASSKDGSDQLEVITEELSDRAITSITNKELGHPQKASTETLAHYLLHYDEVRTALTAAMLHRFPGMTVCLSGLHELALPTDIGPPVEYDIPFAGLRERFIADHFGFLDLRSGRVRGRDYTVTQTADETVFTQDDREWIYRQEPDGSVFIEHPGIATVHGPTRFSIRDAGAGKIWVVARGDQATTDSLDPYIQRFQQNVLQEQSRTDRGFCD